MIDWDMSTRTPLGLLTLLNFRGIGKLTAPQFAKEFDRIGQLVEAPDASLPPKFRESIRDRQAWGDAHYAAEKTLETAARENVVVASVFMADYPALLARIADPPPLIYVKGTLRHSIRNVACVGTREPSHFGQTVAQRLTKFLVENKFGIVSGLAIGIDAAAHQAALDSGGYTIAVMASGLDSIYPRSNAELAHKILESGGAWISEQPFGVRAFAQNLIDRDRLQSGLSLGTFVFQTDVIGGTMHTVRFTLTQERLLFAPVPPEKYANEEKSRGIRAIAEQNGVELADQLRATGTYRELLRSRYAECPPAIPVAGVTDYPAVIESLERSAERAERRDLRPRPDPD